MNRVLVWKPSHTKPGCKAADVGAHGCYRIERAAAGFDLVIDGKVVGNFPNMVAAEARAHQEHRERMGRRSA